MARRLTHGLLLCLASLALLPGCQLFAPRGQASEDAHIKQQLHAQQKAAFKRDERFAQMSPEIDPTNNKGTASTQATLPEPIDLPVLEVSRMKQPARPGPASKHEPAAEFGNSNITPVQAVLPPAEVSAKRAYAPSVEAFQDILDGKLTEAIKHLEHYDKDTQEFFLRLLPPLAVFAKKGIGELSSDDIGKVNEQLVGVLAMLRPRSELGITKMCYCKKVYEFGNYVPLAANHAFVAGSPDRLGELVQLYVELKNFGSEPTPDSMYLTKLACTLELRDAASKTVWSHTYPRQVTTHRRQTRLNDFYSNFSFYVPALAPGAYQLTIQIADESSPERRRAVAKSLDFRVTPVTSQTTSR